MPNPIGLALTAHKFWHLSWSVESRADRSILDVRVGHRGTAALRLNLLRVTGVWLAGATSDTGGGCVSVFWVAAVQPHHAGMVVIPYTEGQNHGGQGVAHTLESPVLREDVVIAECLLLGSAEVGGDRVTSDTVNVRCGIGDDFTALHVEALDLRQGPRVGAISSNELGYHRNWGGRVNQLAGAIERLIAHAVSVEVTTIRVASSCITFAGVSSSTSIALTHGLSGIIARMGCVGRRDAVGFPDIHLGAAGTVATNTGILVAVGRLPSFYVGLISNVTIFGRKY